ncbi:MAG: hypothetical protein IJV43_08210 [Oscillospiraceae bacterium]|nr:hypothetical protein [Oscillospiraceae bacterium]
MTYRIQDDATVLALFLVFLLLAVAALIVAWGKGRQWGDLSSRRHYGEALTEDEQKALGRSRRNFFLWAGVSLAMAALSFYALQ